MRKCTLVSAILLAGALACSPRGQAQTAPGGAVAPPVSIHVDGWGRVMPKKGKIDPNAAPAPKRDLSGIWEPTKDWRSDVNATGAKAMPSDGKPEHELPYTPLGKQMFMANKPAFGTTAVDAAFTNDPFDTCEPAGFPRILTFNLRAFQIYQSATNIGIIYQFNNVWRVIWQDGRKFPDDLSTLEPRFYGYSVGKWTDDYTLVVDTKGLDERTWVDNAGRPHSDDLSVQEVYHRINRDTFELTVTITDPKIYTKPWIALNKEPFSLQPADFDIREMLCSPAESAAFKKQVLDGESGVAEDGKKP
jgi:hypothetical protein